MLYILYIHIYIYYVYDIYLYIYKYIYIYIYLYQGAQLGGKRGANRSPFEIEKSALILGKKWALLMSIFTLNFSFKM